MTTTAFLNLVYFILFPIILAQNGPFLFPSLLIGNNSFGDLVTNTVATPTAENFTQFGFEPENFTDFFNNDPFFSSGDFFSTPQDPYAIPQDPFFKDLLEIEDKFNLSDINDQFDPFNYNSEEVRDQMYSRMRSFEVQDDKNNDYNKVKIIGNNTYDQNLSNHRTHIENNEQEQAPQPTPLISKGRSFISSVIAVPGTIISKINPFKKSTTTTETPTTNLSDYQRIRLNCSEYQTEYNGKCYDVLKQIPCPQGQWLVEDENTNKGKCVDNPCPQHKALFGDTCVTIRSSAPCNTGMRTYIYKSGEVECDCMEGHIFNEEDGKCYPAFRQGPCDQGMYFTIPCESRRSLLFGRRDPDPKLLKPTCIRNACLADKFVCNAPRCRRQRNCIQLGTVCPTGGVYTINVDRICANRNLIPIECEDLHKPDRIIGNVPQLKCAKGSRRDVLGTCRKPSRIDFS